MTINETVDFSQAPLDVRRAFLRPPVKTRLNPGKRLYRWSGSQPDNGQSLSAWWSFVDPVRLSSGEVAEGFRRHEELARRLKKTHREYARARVAISAEFRNPMTHLVLGSLRFPAYGFAGRASGQPEFQKELKELNNVFFIGGAVQLWIPNLVAGIHLQLIKVDA